jgi:hypothetical protein
MSPALGISELPAFAGQLALGRDQSALHGADPHLGVQEGLM